MQQKKGDKYFQKHNYSPDTQLFDISTKKTREINIKITFKNNKFTRSWVLFVPEHNPLKILHQFHHRNQIHLITLPCIAVSLPKHCRLAWRVEKKHLIKLNELIVHHTTCYIRLEIITSHRTITQHHNTNQAENDGKIPKCFDTAVWFFLSSRPE